jgi:hypothetical protein
MRRNNHFLSYHQTMNQVRKNQNLLDRRLAKIALKLAKKQHPNSLTKKASRYLLKRRMRIKSKSNQMMITAKKHQPVYVARPQKGAEVN